MSCFGRLAVAVLLAGLLLLACDPDPGPLDVGESDAGEDPPDGGELEVLAFPCMVEAPSACPEPAPRFADVTPIFKARCGSCHASDWTGPWPLDTYAHVADWADTIQSHLLDCSMPPPDAGMPLPEAESRKILTWIRCNMPR